MIRTTLLATTSLCFMATPTFADGAGGKTQTGLGDVGYMYSNFDADGSSEDLDVDTFHGAGSVHWSFNNGWNAQGNFAFAANHLDFGGELGAIDVFKFGAAGFWRDPNEGAIGGEIQYQSLDVGEYVDGIGLTGRGELYLPEITLAAGVRYSNYDHPSFELDEWSLNGHGTYFVQPDLGARLGIVYTNWDGDGGEADADDWAGYGELEYLIPDCSTSIYGNLTFGSMDFDESPAGIDHWGIGLGARVRFGTTGNLIQRQRTGPLEPLRNSIALLPF